jgi:bifunctional non-homologous end joining protein LigD
MRTPDGPPAAAAKPMKARDLQNLIDWDGPDPFARLGGWLNPDWAAEPKYDGCRAGLVILDDQARFGGSRSASFPVFGQLGIPGLAGTVLDGEFLAPAMPGYSRPLLNHSAGLFNSGPRRALQWQRMYGPPRYVVFDVLAVAGTDATGLSYAERRALLAKITSRILDRYPGCGVELIDQLPADAASIETLLERGCEGAVLKRVASTYQPGTRSADWMKVKQLGTLDCYLTGEYKPGENGRAGTVGAVEMAVYDAAGQPQPVGYVAVKPQWVTEVTDPGSGGLRAHMAGRVIEVMAQGVNEYGQLRHPRMLRWRPDKAPADCLAAQLALIPQV